MTWKETLPHVSVTDIGRRPVAEGRPPGPTTQPVCTIVLYLTRPGTAASFFPPTIVICSGKWVNCISASSTGAERSQQNRRIWRNRGSRRRIVDKSLQKRRKMFCCDITLFSYDLAAFCVIDDSGR
jgi:hypothetical protein